ncbi:MAG TPA: SDR family oxidoreductase [Bryobacteraceae bacterium]|nr:SDR family oxidoreductase [Bryobacteraceae bacterium]
MILQSQKAIVTGCGRGLGAVVAQTMWREGADLLLVDRLQSALSEFRESLAASRPQQQALAFPIDLGDSSAPRAIFDEARRLWPRLDILINNAGIQGPIGMVADNDWAAWRETVQIDLLAPAELCQLAITWMRRTGGGRIVNLGGGGAAGLRPNFSAYATAKCGLIKFTETIAAEVASLGIRVNSIAPGPMNTAMLQEILRAGEDHAGAKEYAQVSKQVASGATNPQIAADLIVYLASEQSAGVTGKLISAVWDPWQTLHEHAADLRASDVYTLRRIVPADRGLTWPDA